VSTVTWLKAQIRFQGGRQRKVLHVLTIKVLPDDETTKILEIQRQRNFEQPHPSNLDKNNNRSIDNSFLMCSSTKGWHLNELCTNEEKITTKATKKKYENKNTKL